LTVYTKMHFLDNLDFSTVYIQHWKMKPLIFLILSIISCSSADSRGGGCGLKASWGDRNSDELNGNDRILTFDLPEHYNPFNFTGYQFGDSKAVEDGFGLDLKTGIFTAPKTSDYFVTVSAFIQTNQRDFYAYAQIFILWNNQLKSLDDYLLVEVNGNSAKVSELRRTFHLQKGDTLKLLVGHHTTMKTVYTAYGRSEYLYGLNLQDIKFCIF